MTQKRRGAHWFIDEETDQYLAGLDLGMPPEDPPGRLWSRIAASMEAAEEDNTVIRVDAGRWRTYAPGIKFKRLWTRDTFLLTCEAGSVVPDHEHHAYEHTVVISGNLMIDGVTYGPGDYLGTPKGGTHPNWTTRTGCIVLVHYEAA